MNQTKKIDNILCPKCRKNFDGAEAINYDVSRDHSVVCPWCETVLSISVSVEYMATIEEGDAE